MSRYHISRAGQPALCKAEVRACPIGGEHYESEREAGIALVERERVREAFRQGNIEVRSLPENVIQAPDRAVVPAGRYFLGDPCYTAGKADEAWQQWVDVADTSSDGFRNPICGATYNGLPIVASSTAYGDGCYTGNNGVEYGVDAGMIGVVPEEVVNGMGLTDGHLLGSGSWIEVTEPTALEFDADTGTIYFGPVAIHTGDDVEQWYCERCGSEVDEGSEYCYSCERDIEEEEQAEEYEEF